MYVLSQPGVSMEDILYPGAIPRAATRMAGRDQDSEGTGCVCVWGGGGGRLRVGGCVCVWVCRCRTTNTDMVIIETCGFCCRHQVVAIEKVSVMSVQLLMPLLPPPSS